MYNNSSTYAHVRYRFDVENSISRIIQLFWRICNRFRDGWFHYLFSSTELLGRSHHIKGDKTAMGHESSRAPLDDSSNLRVVKSDGWLTFANSKWLWSVDINTGQEIDRFYCDDSDEVVNFPKIPSNCDLGLILDDGIYTITRGGDLKYIPTQDLASPYRIQAEWGLPPYVDIGDEFIEAQTLDDMLLITTERVIYLSPLKKREIVQLDWR